MYPGTWGDWSAKFCKCKCDGVLVRDRSCNVPGFDGQCLLSDGVTRGNTEQMVTGTPCDIECPGKTMLVWKCLVKDLNFKIPENSKIPKSLRIIPNFLYMLYIQTFALTSRQFGQNKWAFQ